VTSWEVWFGEPKANNIVSLGVSCYSSVHYLCYAIMLRNFGHSFLKPDAMASTILFERTSIFIIIICLNTFQLPSSLSFNLHVKDFEHVQHLIFSFQSKNPHFSKVIINKGHIIKCTTKSFSVHSADISVN
jgi:hypothetical protein